ncbi:MAG: CBS domain-containing protein [Thermaerobacter sp.]|jgi:CBS domain-containing protein|nr:CBS domain-containing protein [Thermaerobacter sp.]MDA8145933.1 CBS domain-containing protein [Thermaerobacter sp.]
MKSRVSQLMTERLSTCQADTPLREVAEIFRRDGVGAVVVVDAEQGKAQGIVTAMDLLHALRHGAPPRTATEVMHAPVLTAHPEEDAQEAARRMRREGVHRLVVVGDDGKPGGIFSTRDMVRELAEAPAAHITLPVDGREQARVAARGLMWAAAVLLATGGALAATVVMLSWGVPMLALGVVALVLSKATQFAGRSREVICPHCHRPTRVPLGLHVFTCPGCLQQVQVLYHR